jgi:tight adherence protein C
MAITISIALFLFIAAAISLYGYNTYAKPARVLEGLNVPIPGLRGAAAAQQDKLPEYKVTRILQWVGEKLPADPQIASITRRQLMAAGFRSDAALPVFHGLRALTCFGFVCAALILTRFTHLHQLLTYAIWFVAGILGYLLVGLALDYAVTRYHETLRLSLPDALDLLIVCVEAGLGLDQAIRKVSDELALTHPEICREFALVSLEMRTGVKRTDAFHNMADRTMESELRKFVAIMVQTDRFGTSIADSLRAHSEFMRIRRRQIAEERANKLGVKLIIPVFFLILPAIMIIAGGPAFMRLNKELSPPVDQSTTTENR